MEVVVGKCYYHKTGLMASVRKVLAINDGKVEYETLYGPQLKNQQRTGRTRSSKFRKWCHGEIREQESYQHLDGAIILPTFLVRNTKGEVIFRCGTKRAKFYSHLGSCKGCQRCVSLTFRLKREVDSNRHFLDKMICARLHTARETRILHNNHEFMTRMAAKYGDRPARYLISDDILFLVIDTPEGKVCVTCMDARDSILGDFVRRPKYKKKQSMECVAV